MYQHTYFSLTRTWQKSVTKEPVFSHYDSISLQFSKKKTEMCPHRKEKKIFKRKPSPLHFGTREADVF